MYVYELSGLIISDFMLNLVNKEMNRNEFG
jgi:hypothetical protein